jgi:hypothetical protein
MDEFASLFNEVHSTAHLGQQPLFQISPLINVIRQGLCDPAEVRSDTLQRDFHLVSNQLNHADKSNVEREDIRAQFDPVITDGGHKGSTISPAGTNPVDNPMADVKPKRGRPRIGNRRHTHGESARNQALARNRLAARKYRQRDADATERLRIRAEECASMNHTLKEDIKRLREEALSLRSSLLHHASCGVRAIDLCIEKYMEDAARFQTMVGKKDAVQQHQDVEAQPT